MILILTSCSGIRMERPEPEVYEGLKQEKLFGIWTNSRTRLEIACTGRVKFVEKRNGEVFNQDDGGKVSKIDGENTQFIVSGLFGSNKYHYNLKDEDTLEFLVGKRADWMETAKVAASWMTIVSPDEKLTLKRQDKVDCDKEPVTLGEVFKDMGQKLKGGEFEVVEPKKP